VNGFERVEEVCVSCSCPVDGVTWAHVGCRGACGPTSADWTNVLSCRPKCAAGAKGCCHTIKQCNLLQTSSRNTSVALPAITWVMQHRLAVPGRPIAVRMTLLALRNRGLGGLSNGRRREEV
jgi:hypothetical protein